MSGCAAPMTSEYRQNSSALLLMLFSMLGGMSARRTARKASSAPYTPKIAPEAPALLRSGSHQPLATLPDSAESR